ncbi:hypothetical protein ERJ75_000501700 [Trypanosoma vivax]|nr:hypothetical protein ERJ75_000501700 [Trypanosoma vivax]
MESADLLLSALLECAADELGSWDWVWRAEYVLASEGFERLLRGVRRTPWKVGPPLSAARDCSGRAEGALTQARQKANEVRRVRCGSWCCVERLRRARCTAIIRLLWSPPHTCAPHASGEHETRHPLGPAVRSPTPPFC